MVIRALQAKMKEHQAQPTRHFMDGSVPQVGFKPCQRLASPTLQQGSVYDPERSKGDFSDSTSIPYPRHKTGYVQSRCGQHPSSFFTCLANTQPGCKVIARGQPPRFYS